MHTGGASDIGVGENRGTLNIPPPPPKKKREREREKKS